MARKPARVLVLGDCFGKGALQAIAAARAGASVTLITCFPDNERGRSHQKLLQYENVDCSRSIRRQKPRLTENDVNDRSPTIRECDVILVSLEIPMNTVLAALKHKRESSCTIVDADPMSSSGLPTAIYDYCRILIVNERQFRVIADEGVRAFNPTKFRQRFCFELSAPQNHRTYNCFSMCILVLRGSKGIANVNGDEPVTHLELTPPVTSVDRDRFCACAAAAWATNVKDTLKFAMIGAKGYSKQATIKALPYRDEIWTTYRSSKTLMSRTTAGLEERDGRRSQNS